jgi:hypothetical protein
LQEVFLSKIHSIITGNNVLDAAASNIAVFLSRDTFVSSTQLNRPTWSNRPYLNLETHKLRKHSFQKGIQLS